MYQLAMATFSSEQLNFFKFSTVVLDEFPVALRKVFVCMWDTLVATKHGGQKWDNSRTVLNLFLSNEGGAANVPTLNKFIEEWDCTALFKATLFAQTFAMSGGSGGEATLFKLYIKRSLASGTFHSSVLSPYRDQAETFALALDQLRLLRNTLFHQISTKKIDKTTLDKFLLLAKDAFVALGQETCKIDDIEKLGEEDFPTARVQQLEDELNREKAAAAIKFKQIEDRLNQIESEVKEVRTDVKDVKTGLENVKSDVKEIKADVHDQAMRTENPVKPARLRIHIDAELVPGPDGETTGIVVASPASQLSLQSSKIPTSSSQQQDIDGSATGLVTTLSNKSVPIATQNVLIRIAEMYLQAHNLSTPEDFSDFENYMARIRKTMVVATDFGCLIITVECGSLHILDELWKDYRTGHLNEMAQKLLVTEDILKEFNLLEVKLTTTILEEEYRACREYFLLSQGSQLAIPLCLPNNCAWDSKTSQCVQTGEKRHSLYVVEEALEKLRKVKGPVCVVSIAGSYRTGKSYILSQAFGQPQVFPLGHHMDPETMGIWLWIVPEKFKDAGGQKCTVVLLDSEGIDSVSSEGFDDNQIFTLTVLLSSVLIYNSQGVPTRRDLEELEFIVKLSQRIEVRSKTENAAAKVHRDEEFFHKTFPFFVWLLRDVTQNIPPDCHNIKDYFLKKVFSPPYSSAVTQEGQIVAESILRFFPGFEAFMLPPPTVDTEVLKSINDNKSRINVKFFHRFEEFKHLLSTRVLTPKNSFNDGELVTGEGLAALVELYVQSINIPGGIPNVQNAWETFVEMKSSEAVKRAVEKYETMMTSQLKDKRPCDNDELRKTHGIAFENSEGYFMSETEGISTNTTETYLNKLKKLLGEKLNEWQTRNETLTREFCNNLLSKLRQSHLDTVLIKLQGKEGAQISYQDIISEYQRIYEDYHNSAIGAKDVIAAVFYKFYPTLMKEQEQYLGLLGKLKDYDEALTKELEAKAYQEQERQRLEEQQELLRQENLALKKEMEMVGRKQNEERKKLHQKMETELKTQKKQMENMMEANMKQLRKERDEFMQENQNLTKKLLAAQKANEDIIKMVKKLSDLVAKQEEEKRHHGKQMESDQAAMHREREELEATHREQQERLLREVEEKMEEVHASELATARLQNVEKRQEQLDLVRRQLAEEDLKQASWSSII